MMSSELIIDYYKETKLKMKQSSVNFSFDFSS